jgi:hypothetical protein
MFKRIKIWWLRKRLKRLNQEKEQWKGHWCGTPLMNIFYEINEVKRKLNSLSR